MNLLRLVKDTRILANSNKKAKTCLLFLDLKSAFDNVDRQTTLRNLKSAGIDPDLCQLIRLVWQNLTLNGIFSSKGVP